MREEIVPRSVTLRAMVPDDLTAAHGLTAAIGWPHRPEDWRMLFGLGAGLVACEGGRVIGTAMSWRHGGVATEGSCHRAVGHPGHRSRERARAGGALASG